MKKLTLLLFVVLFTFSLNAQNSVKMENNSNKLVVLWTSSDPDVAEKMGFMYTYNAKKQGWFDEVVLIVWGPSAKLLAENKMLQDYVKKMKEAGVIIEACSACANMYGVGENLKELGIDVKRMGIPLSNYLKEGWKSITI